MTPRHRFARGTTRQGPGSISEPWPDVNLSPTSLRAITQMAGKYVRVSSKLGVSSGWTRVDATVGQVLGLITGVRVTSAMVSSIAAATSLDTATLAAASHFWFDRYCQSRGQADSNTSCNPTTDPAGNLICLLAAHGLCSAAESTEP